MSSTKLSVGIVGLPNVGKSTLFNALLKKQAALAANYPFATIEPNVGVVPVPDARLTKLAEITRDSIALLQNDNRLPPIKNALIEFVDIAGLVKGAATGAGLGNKFLSHIREVKVIAHVVRAFVDEDVIREGSVGAKEDYETIAMELILADVATIENAKVKMQKSKPQLKNQNFFQEVIEKLNKGIAIREMQFTEEEQAVIDQLFLLTAKPEIIVLNVSEEDYTPEGIKKVTEEYQEMLKLVQHDKNGDDVGNIVVICAKIEAELAALSDEEQKEYLHDLGLSASGLERLIQKAYQELGLISFLTAGEKEVKAWTTRQGIDAQHAAGEIHTDFIKKFIKAEVVAFDDFVANNGWKGAREKGKARLEGKDYIVKDGDVVEFKIGS